MNTISNHTLNLLTNEDKHTLHIHNVNKIYTIMHIIVLNFGCWYQTLELSTASPFVYHVTTTTSVVPSVMVLLMI